MGGNNFGQLGNGTKKRSLVPVPCKSLERKKVVEIACGHHSAAVTGNFCYNSRLRRAVCMGDRRVWRILSP